MELNYLPIEVENIKESPDLFEVEINNVTLIFLVYYNKIYDYFGFNIYSKDGEVIIEGRKIVYGVNMFSDVVDNRLPNVKIYPYSKNSEITSITYNNFMDDVKPYIVEGDI